MNLTTKYSRKHWLVFLFPQEGAECWAVWDIKCPFAFLPHGFGGHWLDNLRGRLGTNPFSGWKWGDVAWKLGGHNVRNVLPVFSCWPSFPLRACVLDSQTLLLPLLQRLALSKSWMWRHTSVFWEVLLFERGENVLICHLFGLLPCSLLLCIENRVLRSWNHELLEVFSLEWPCQSGLMFSPHENLLPLLYVLLWFNNTKPFPFTQTKNYWIILGPTHLSHLDPAFLPCLTLVTSSLSLPAVSEQDQAFVSFHLAWCLCLLTLVLSLSFLLSSPEILSTELPFSCLDFILSPSSLYTLVVYFLVE